VAELRAVAQSEPGKRRAKPKTFGGAEIADYNVDCVTPFMPIAADRRAIYGRGGSVHARAIGSRRAAEYRSGIAGRNHHVSVA
jgi:hypothetical protein